MQQKQKEKEKSSEKKNLKKINLFKKNINKNEEESKISNNNNNIIKLQNNTSTETKQANTIKIQKYYTNIYVQKGVNTREIKSSPPKSKDIIVNCNQISLDSGSFLNNKGNNNRSLWKCDFRN